MTTRRTLSSFILHPSSFRSGFSLTEVMFAVIILGIGFILVAAIFPVTISQSRLTVEETTAAGTARAAMAQSSILAAGGDAPPTTPPPANWGPLLPETSLYNSPPAAAVNGGPNFDLKNGEQITIPGKVLSFCDERLNDAGVTYRSNLWNAFRGSLTVPSDTRFAWVPLYRRDCTWLNNTGSQRNVPLNPSGLSVIPAPFAQVYFIPVAVRNRSIYDATDVNAGTLSNFVPRRLVARIVPEATASGGYAIAFGDYGPGRPALDSVAEGAFVIISDDRINSPMNSIDGINRNVDQGLMNGHIYRVGVRRPDLDGQNALYLNGGAMMQVWELSAGADFKPDAGANGKFYSALNPDNDDIVAVGNDATCAGIIATALSRPATSFAQSIGPAEVLIIGRNPTAAGYEGASQDVSAFVTFIKAN